MNKFQIIWKYKTPLEGRYIAAFTNRMFSPGLARDPEIIYVPSENLVRISKLELYIHPEGSDDVICKLIGDELTTVTTLPSTEGPIYVSFMWQGASSSEPSVTTSILPYASVPTPESVVIAYKVGTKVYPLGHYTPEYWRERCKNTLFLRRALYGESSLATEESRSDFLRTFVVSHISENTVPTRYLPCRLVTGTSASSYMLPASLSVVVPADIPAGKFLLIGYDLCLRSAPTADTVIPLKVLAVADTLLDLHAPNGTSAIGVVSWTGIAATSEVYDFNSMSLAASDQDVLDIMHQRAFI